MSGDNLMILYAKRGQGRDRRATSKACCKTYRFELLQEWLWVDPPSESIPCHWTGIAVLNFGGKKPPLVWGRWDAIRWDAGVCFHLLVHQPAGIQSNSVSRWSMLVSFSSGSLHENWVWTYSFTGLLVCTEQQHLLAEKEGCSLNRKWQELSTAAWAGAEMPVLHVWRHKIHTSTQRNKLRVEPRDKNL